MNLETVVGSKITMYHTKIEPAQELSTRAILPNKNSSPADASRIII